MRRDLQRDEVELKNGIIRRKRHFLIKEIELGWVFFEKKNSNVNFFQVIEKFYRERTKLEKFSKNFKLCNYFE